MSTQMDVNDTSNPGVGPSSEPSKSAELVNDSMDVDMDEVPPTSASPYKFLIVPGPPPPVMALDLPEDFEEEEAEASSDEDDGNDDDEIDDVEGESTDISTAVLLDKPIDEADDAEDGDYIPNQ